MAAPFNKRGSKNEAFGRRPGPQSPDKQGGSAVRNPGWKPDPLIRKAAEETARRQAEEDAFRDWASKRPLKRRDPSVPQVPRGVERAVQNRAREIASRIIRTGLRLHPFRLVFGWVLDWLFKWLLEWLLKWRPWETGSRGWRKYAECPSPPPGAIRAPVYWGTNLFPPSQTVINQTKSCLAGQGVPKVSADVKDALDDFPYPAYLSAKALSPLAENATTWRNCTQIEVWGRPGPGQVLPSIWYLPGGSPAPLSELAPPSRRVAEALKPDWKQEIEPSRPPDVTVEPDPEAPEQPEPHREIDVGPSSGARTKTGVRVEYRVRQKPTRNREEKEKKFQGTKQVVQSMFRHVARQKENLTEADDFLDTLFEALPKEVQKAAEKRNGRMTPDLKAKAIYDNFGKIDWGDWVKNFVENWIEDKVVGKGLELSDKAARARGATNNIAGRAWLNAR